MKQGHGKTVVVAPGHELRRETAFSSPSNAARRPGGGSAALDTMSLTEDPDCARTARAANRRFYDALWSAGYLVPPHRFNTWRELSALAATASTMASASSRVTSPPRIVISAHSTARLKR